VRYLAIDLGGKRTGLAAGDSITGLVQPLKVVAMPMGDALLAALAREIDEVGPNTVVVGLPLNMDGTEGPAATSVRAFAERLAARAGVPLRFQDERLTSFAAEGRLDRSGRTHKEKRELRDALAAAEILEDFLRASRPQADVEDDGGDERDDDPSG
jgi:putative Holliday junction resolvase